MTIIDSRYTEGFIDVDSESAPAVEKERLYRLWEEGNWSAKSLDLTQDTIDWREKHTDQQRAAILWNFAMFLDGEESVTVTLAPFVEAAPRAEDKIFLATQIADEARHHVFFDRFMREMVGIGSDMKSTLTAIRPQLTWGYVQVFRELDVVADRLRRSPRNLPLLAQGIVLYHLVIEGMLAHTGQHFLRDYAKRNGYFPSFGEGINMVARDESRHIAFGIQLLRELVTSSPACKVAAISMLNRVLPWAAGVFTPPDLDWSYISRLGYSAEEVFTFGLRSIETKLGRAGIAPSEVLALVKLGCSEPPSAQARRVIALIESGMLGTDKAPFVSERAMDTTFTSICNVAAWTQTRQRPLSATIQWHFDECEPRYLELDPQHAPQVNVGQAPHPDLTLRSKAVDWLSIAKGSLSQTQALLTQRLQIQGDWKLALQLPRVLPV
jgi:hypothetical protein